MRKLHLSVAIAVIMSLLSVAGTLAYSIASATYSGAIRITNNGTATVNQTAIFTLNTTSLINAGFVNSALNNTAVIHNGQSIPFMPGASGNFPWNVWVSNISALTNLDYTLYTGGNQSMNSTIAYFPGPDGMTTTDNASLELGNNFTITQTGFIDTTAGANKTLVYKPGAITTNISGAGNITSSIGTADAPVFASNASSQQTTNVTAHVITMPSGTVAGDLILVNIASGNATWTFPSGWTQLQSGWRSEAIRIETWYFRVTTTVNTTISANTSYATWSAHYSHRLTNAGTPQAGVSMNGTNNSPDPPNLTPSGGSNNYVWQAVAGIWRTNFSPPPVVTGYPGSYSGVTNTAYVTGADSITISTANRTLTASSENPGGFTLDAGGIVNEWVANTIAIPPMLVQVTATGIASGNHTVTTTADSTNLSISVDGVLKATTPLLGVSVPNNANNWQFATANATPYLTRQQITINGTLRQDISWQYIPVGGAIQFTDNSGNGNTAIPTFRTSGSSPNVTANMTSFTPLTQTTSDPTNPAVTASNITAAFVSPPGLYTELNIQAPGANLTNSLLDGSNIPRAMFWFPFLFGIVCLLGFATAWLTRSMLIQGVVMTFALIVFSLMGGFGYWVVIEFFILAMAFIVGSKQYGL